MTPVLPGLPPTAGPFVIAEAGVNHNGELDLAFRLIDAAVDAGAAAVKFQTFVPELLAAAEAPRAPYQRRDGESESQLDLISSLALTHEEFEQVANHCMRRGILFLSTPFDRGSSDFLLRLDVAALKVPSGELTNIPFLQHLAGSGKPLIVSTGMATLDEVERGVTCIKAAGCQHYALLHCTTSYPAATVDVNLMAMRTLRNAFSCPVGYSDHTLGIEIALAATALGAQIIEKHLTLDRTLAGPDHRSSLEPNEFKRMVGAIQRVTEALGNGIKQPTIGEVAMAKVIRRSLAAARALPAGTTITRADLVELRPGTGIPPDAMDSVVGRRLRRALPMHQLLDRTMLD